MKTSLFTLLIASALLTAGCNTNPEARGTNPRQPGPAVGHAVGTAVGAVGSNVVGAVAAGVEGASAATKSTFTNERRVVRTWRTETTADGRTIQVPVEIEVDEYGRPIEQK
ncbi:MAG: flagellar motor protein MotB [Opitutaceae bacterium]|nr:flagellar motor protein MotB [Opitutaceae bacterium]